MQSGGICVLGILADGPATQVPECSNLSNSETSGVSVGADVDCEGVGEAKGESERPRFVPDLSTAIVGGKMKAEMWLKSLTCASEFRCTPSNRSAIPKSSAGMR